LGAVSLGATVAENWFLSTVTVGDTLEVPPPGGPPPPDEPPPEGVVELDPPPPPPPQALRIQASVTVAKRLAMRSRAKFLEVETIEPSLNGVFLGLSRSNHGPMKPV